ncbi:hypothetical protein FRB94_002648 [Tulasnella sp. JGI-2019a]|nr:hypothetical protein FRB93_005155 [Tulasnella sp. JGI-2019a]KAG9004165.1 hypothetical protein FRB94_002648 [Tulasnella sp. JGI-2019a]
MSSEPKKQEKDFTKEVDTAVAEATSLQEAGKLQEGLDKLFALEKQTRNAADLASTTRLLSTSTLLCYKATNYSLLSSTILVLSKKHGQLKESVKVMVEQAMGWLDDVKSTKGEPTWLELVETLRTVTEGKIYLETPRARLTLLLAAYYERIANDPSTAPAPKPDATTGKTPAAPTPFDSLVKASDLMTELQVETYSSMDRKEKTEFILEQMRLLVLVAKEKDTQAKESKEKSAADKEKKVTAADGEAEWIKVRVGGRKIHEGFLTDKGNEVLKLKYYDLMIQFALHHASYLDAAKYFHKVWETPIIKEETEGRGKEALENIIYYVILAPHDNEQSDMINRLYNDPALAKLELHYNLVKCFITHELVRWPSIEGIYGPTLRQTPVFLTGNAEGDKRWEDLHTRVIEHNIRVIALYYTRITLSRLTSLLDLSAKATEEVLCRLVVSGTVHARIDRPNGVVSFRQKETAEDVLNDWASDVGRLMGLVEKSWMEMNAALAVKTRSG